jgi:hypothetical protein
MNPENCIVCGTVTQDGRHATWGPITLYYHFDCFEEYQAYVAPRLRDALTLAMRRWMRQRLDLLDSQRSTTDREP